MKLYYVRRFSVYVSTFYHSEYITEVEVATESFYYLRVSEVAEVRYPDIRILLTIIKVSFQCIWSKLFRFFEMIKNFSKQTAFFPV